MIAVEYPQQIALIKNVAIETYITKLLRDTEFDSGRDHFESFFGGAFYICENDSDLSKVTGINPSFEFTYERYPNITEAVCFFDYVEKTDEYAVLLLCSNNSGGNTYIIPSALFEAAKIDVHVAANAAKPEF